MKAYGSICKYLFYIEEIEGCAIILIRMVVRMRKNDLFITQAMLSSYLSVDRKNYLALIEPFLLMCLPTEVGEEVLIDSLQMKINENYSLDILYNVVEKILQRLAKKKHGAYIKRADGKYFVNRVYDDTKFDNDKARIKRALENVVESLQQFLVKEKGVRGIETEDVQVYLSTFLETYNYTIYEDVSKANSIVITDDASKSNYYVAQFILKEYEKQSTTYDNILELIKGTLVAKAIYYFMYEENGDVDKKIKGTNFYFDTRLLIGALGINSDQENSAMQELMLLIKIISRNPE